MRLPKLFSGLGLGMLSCATHAVKRKGGSGNRPNDLDRDLINPV